jgi:hypothetical protein
LDTVEWPDNKVCSHQVKYNLAQEWVNGWWY